MLQHSDCNGVISPVAILRTIFSGPGHWSRYIFSAVPTHSTPLIRNDVPGPAPNLEPYGVKGSEQQHRLGLHRARATFHLLS